MTERYWETISELRRENRMLKEEIRELEEKIKKLTASGWVISG